MASLAMKSELLSEGWMLDESMMLKEEVEDKMKEKARKGIPKPSFSLNLVTVGGRPQCPAPKKKAKKALHFPIFAVSKRKLHLEEEFEQGGTERPLGP